MNLADVMDEIAGLLSTIDGLRVSAHPTGTIVPPGAVVGYPSAYTYDATYGRGSDRLSLPVVVVVGKAVDRAARDALAQYVSGSGDRSLKQVLEGADGPVSYSAIRVTGAEFDVYQLSSVDYISAIFDLEIIGPGA